VALFENDEFVDPRSISYLAQGRFPTLADLDADANASRQVYEVVVRARYLVAAGLTLGEAVQ
jgi:hypothetical protein